jgi:hypothetical protein
MVLQDVTMYPMNLLRRLFRQEERQTTRPIPGRTYNILCDSGNDMVLAMSHNPSAIILAHECTPDSYKFTDVTHPNYKKDFPLLSVRGDSFAEWSWQNKARKFIKTNPELLTQEYIERSRLAGSKVRAFELLIYGLNMARQPVRTGVDFQETVYLIKKAEAAAFKATGYDESRLFEYPYVLQYADFAKIPAKEAADAILFSAKLDEQLLMRSELLRLKYFKKVKDATSPEEMKTIIDGFYQERHERALV